MVRDLQLQEGCCVSLASLQLPCSNDLFTFFLSCCWFLGPSEKQRRVQVSPQLGLPHQQCPVGGFTPAQALNFFLH